MDLTTLTILAASNLISTGQLSPVELTWAYLERIERIDPMLNCYITLTPELALQQARRVEKSLVRRRRPASSTGRLLQGIPIALKDLFHTKGVRTTAGSTFFSDFVPGEDAFVVEKLHRDGAVILGKLNMHEIALGVTNVNPHFGPCRNPWDPSHITGGSSGGCAAALIARLCLGCLGTDSGGSIRIPSALCGVVGLKPTYGRVSLRGVIPLSWTCDHAGPIARNIMDAAIMLQGIAGFDRLHPYSIYHSRENFLAQIQDGVQGWRIGLVNDCYFDKTDPEVSQAIQAAALTFEQLGAKVEPVEFPGLYETARANSLVVPAEAAVYHRERLQNHPDGFGEDVLRRLRSGASCNATDYILARQIQTVQRHQFEQVIKIYDFFIMPTTPITAPPIEGPDAVEQVHLLTRYTAPFNLTGLPALSMPCGFTRDGLPVGMQLVAGSWSEGRLLSAGYAYEQATTWHQQVPTLEKN
jgi:aspartyl-tRNA(Asn)/glutamyl-tRNA(Gln) amidotransferase subunit A